MSSDSTKKTISVALGVCLVCSVFVSSATVALDSVQRQNKKLDKIKNILQAGNLTFNINNAEEIFKEKIVPVIVDLENGSVLDKSKYTADLNPESFNIKSLSESKNYGKDILPEEDLGNIKKRPKYMLSYEVLNSDKQIEKYIFPIFGKGLWSTMYGFIALNKDLRTVEGITFYEHGETPGLGGEVDNQNWKASWKGKEMFDEKGNEVLTVLKGKVDPNDPNKNKQIDGLSGATLTTRGVGNLIKYWMGEDGYAKFLGNIRKDI
ncbi:MAG: Na(+)-translocating NADH-quinone reductase subunit C [Ignavibacteriales bacterium]|nr:Na(+)-translocating NADH-quinone reductase subunit C [Ignavibacteriales bacterium]MBK7981981.1 Na(+)-translocating NADH-quinone reductase subunit C [Ignavibacteriota bacterium]